MLPVLVLDYIEKVTDETGPFYRDLRVVPELSFFYIGFNTTKPPFDDVNIRRAFSQAIDKDKAGFSGIQGHDAAGGWHSAPGHARL